MTNFEYFLNKVPFPFIERKNLYIFNINGKEFKLYKVCLNSQKNTQQQINRALKMMEE